MIHVACLNANHKKGVACGIYPEFIQSLNFPAHVNVTTLLAGNIMSSPVEGFRPLRSLLSLTWNLPNPEIIASSPDSRVRFMISSRVSTISVDLLYVLSF